MTDLLPSLPTSLTQDEVEFIYNVEVLGLPARKAASMAGMAVNKITAAHIIQAREQVKRELRGAMAITKEDIVFGMREAIDRAKVINEPATEIMGWEKIAKLLGYDAPQKVDVNLKGTVEVINQTVRTMDDAELVKLLGADDIIDGEFYDVGSGHAA